MKTSRRHLLTTLGAVVTLAGCKRFYGRVASAELFRSPYAGLANTLSDLEIYVSADDEFDAKAKIHNPRVQKKPQAIVFPRSTRDVQTIVRWAREHDHTLSIRCGGHSYEGYCIGSDILLDVSRFRDFQISDDGSTVRIGAGWTQGELYEKLFAAGKTMVMGSCPSVGISGFALGGGYGYLSRLYGMACDNLVSVEMVDVNGNIVYANAESNSDLFWALRGAGGSNFGIVTALRFKIYDAPRVTVFLFEWPWDQVGQISSLWFDWAPTAPGELAASLGLGGKLVSISGQFVGSPDTLQTLLPARWPKPTVKNTSVQKPTFMDAVRYFSGGGGASPRFKAQSEYWQKPMSHTAVVDIKAALDSAPGNTSPLAMIDAYGGAIAQLKNTDTAFVHREGMLGVMQTMLYWNRAADDEKNLAWFEHYRNAIAPYVSGYSYQNYADSTRTDWQHAYYGENWDRLVEIKRKYDPSGWLSFPQGIPVHS